MENKGSLTKILAVLGAILVWIPLLAPIFFSIVSLIGDGIFRFDYLMPAELFPIALLGAGLLLMAAFRARSYWKLISRALGAALILLFGGQALAVVTGLASGAIEATGWQWVLVLGSIIAFDLALALVGVGGVLLCRHLFKSQP